jgi:hypothetical protein
MIKEAQLTVIEQKLQHILDLLAEARTAVYRNEWQELAKASVNIAQSADQLHTYLYDEKILERKV